MGEPDASSDATQEALNSAYQTEASIEAGRLTLHGCDQRIYDELRRRQRQPVTLTPETHDGNLLDDPYWVEDDAPAHEKSEIELQATIQHCINALDEKIPHYPRFG